MMYKDLQQKLKQLRNSGMVLTVKLNAKQEVLQLEYDRLTRDLTKADTDFVNYIRPAMATVATSPSLIAMMKDAPKAAPLTESERVEVMSGVKARQVARQQAYKAEAKCTVDDRPAWMKETRNTLKDVKPVKPLNYDNANKPARQQQYDRRKRDAKKSDTNKVASLPTAKVSLVYSATDKSEYFSTYTSKRAA